MSDLAERLRIAREQAGLSQGQTAKLLDLHRPTISEIEAGRRKVKAEELAQFGEAYGVSVAWWRRPTRSPKSTHASLSLRASSAPSTKTISTGSFGSLAGCARREERSVGDLALTSQQRGARCRTSSRRVRLRFIRFRVSDRSLRGSRVGGVVPGRAQLERLYFPGDPAQVVISCLRPSGRLRHTAGHELGTTCTGTARASTRNSTIDSTVEHLSARKQFGRPLGTFQALRHRMAECAVLAAGVKWLALKAASTAAEGDAALAAFHAQQSATRITYDLHQILGAMG